MQKPADGVPGPVLNPHARLPEARAACVPGQEGGRPPVRFQGRVAGDGGVPATWARQGHRRQQLHDQAPRQDVAFCHHHPCSEPGTVAADRPS